MRQPEIAAEFDSNKDGHLSDEGRGNLQYLQMRLEWKIFSQIFDNLLICLSFGCSEFQLLTALPPEEIIMKVMDMNSDGRIDTSELMEVRVVQNFF